jgi:F-type H+-transporting ATPase subunit epsilon
MTIRCEIVSQNRLVYEGDVDIVNLPGSAGEMGILPNHSPLLATLKMGVVTVRTGSDEEVFTITGGVVEVQPEIITVLADAAEHVEEIDIARAEEAKNRAEELMADGPSRDDMDTFLAIEAALRRSNLRLDAIKKYRSGRGRIRKIETERDNE